MTEAATVHQDMYTRFVSRFLFPLHERLKGHDTVHLRHALETTQWWSPRQLAELQLARLRELLQSAYRYVPYYTRVMEEAGVDVASIDSLDALSKLPLLTKGLIRANLEQLKSTRARGLIRFNTGGSSGEPLIFYIGPERITHDVAAKWRATRWWDVDIGDPEIVLWGSPIELNSQDRFRAIRDRLLRTTLLPAFNMSPLQLDRFLTEIIKKRPRMLFGYPSALARVARYAGDKGVDVSRLGVRVAFVTSECLYADQRRAIETAFGCRVANGYGGRDSGFLAHECPAGGMHMMAEDVIIEIVDEGGDVLSPGRAGEVVVTHLATRDFPFIRYRTGDVAVVDDRPCSCGRGLPLLREIQGRTTDFITAADGTVMHGLALIYVIRDLPGIKAFKIVQESLTLTRVLLVPEAGFDPDCVETIRGQFKSRLGEPVDIDVKQVNEIPAERSGKYRYVVSRLNT
jgi:phenylacetate-CoA ligase